MLFRLLLLFVLVPVAELILLIRLGEWIGLWPTLGLIVVTGVVGSVLARQQGFSVLRRLQSRLGRGGLPGRELMDGAIILISGALLLTPGVVTDVVGFAGLIPPTRALIRAGLARWLKKKVRSGSADFQVFWSGSGPGPAGETGPDRNEAGSSSAGRSGRRRDGTDEVEVSYEIVEEDGEAEANERDADERTDSNERTESNQDEDRLPGD